VKTLVRTLLFVMVLGTALSALAAEPCCFVNPRFSGTCKVTPGEDETCASILAFLNNPNSVGRAYCGGTDIRGGWTQTECENTARSMCAPPAETAAPPVAFDEPEVPVSPTPET
jgi:hypothetical protein